MKKKYFFSVGIHKATVLKLFFSFILLIISRLLLYFFNIQFFKDIDFIELITLAFYGLRFDLFTLVLIAFPLLFFNSLPIKIRYNSIYQLIVNIIFYFTNAIAFTANCIDVVYYRFTLKRTTADIFNYLNYQDNMNVLIPQFIYDFWYMFLIWIGLIFMLVFLCHKIKINNKVLYHTLYYYVGQTLIFIAFLLFSLVGIRGGFQLKPISIITAGNYTSSPKIQIVVNTPFTIVKTWGQKGLKEEHYFKDIKDASSIYSPFHHEAIDSLPPFRKLNVVIIILESFSQEHIHALNKNIDNGRYKGFTPFLDSLINESYVFEGFANGKRSIEGIPAILSGLPTLMDKDYITSAFAANKMFSLANYLKKEGYHSSFFHGGNNGTMNFDSYVKTAGFDAYFGRNEYNNDTDFDGKWGIWDEPFLQFFAKKLNGFSQPFLSSVFTLSSHHPYKIPQKYENKFPKGELPIQQTIAYSDYSLMKFFKTAQKMRWFDSTLFVITADHTSEAALPYYETVHGNFRIPIFFYMHNSPLKGKANHIAQQIDILPSILSVLHYNDNYIAFGTNAFDNSAIHFDITYSGSGYQLICDNYLLQFNGKASSGLYYIPGDPFCKKNLVNSLPVIKNKLELLCKALIQQYNYRMINNKLTEFTP
ncbi:MAG: sulfatase-like hydrolase/transferase [Lentimicrobiaceae bacterium]|nr:sulfatase-like hydrolase/transferase [Lentimicrobiaceae bacterium]